MSHDDFDFEPIPGLPENLPPGEKILWQGAPQWWGLALRSFHIRKIAVYFALLVAWQGVAALADGAFVAGAALEMVTVLPLALTGLAILAGLAALYARTTIYTITNKRIVLRFGIALPMSVNLPFNIVDHAALRIGGDGTGDIPVSLRGEDRIAYLALWPLVRPGHYRKPQPMLRALRDAPGVAALLSTAMQQDLAEGVVHPVAADGRKPAQAPAMKPGLAVAEH